MSKFAVLFDLDGTLVDSIDLLVQSMQHAFAGRTRRPPVEEWVSRIGTPLTAMMGDYAADQADLDHLIARYREYQVGNHDAMTTAYPGIVDAIRELHAAGHPLGVVTSKYEEGARRSLRLIGVEQCFTTVVGIGQTTRHKPEPEPVWYALEQLGMPRSARAVFIGDSPHDMHAGNAAGVATAAATWGPFTTAQLEVSRPRHWLREVPAIVPLVRSLAGQ